MIIPTHILMYTYTHTYTYICKKSDLGVVSYRIKQFFSRFKRITLCIAHVSLSPALPPFRTCAAFTPVDLNKCAMDEEIRLDVESQRLCMYVCIYNHIYIYIYTYIHIYIHIHIYICKYIYIYICIYIYVCICMSESMCCIVTCIYTCIYVCMCMCVYTYIYNVCV